MPKLSLMTQIPPPMTPCSAESLARILAPAWNGSLQQAETTVFVGDEKLAAATLLLRPRRVLAVRSYDHRVRYELNADYRIDASQCRLVRCAGSRIPILPQASLYVPQGAASGIAHKAGEPLVWLRYGEYSFPPFQVEVDYEADEEWFAAKPESKATLLPRLVRALEMRRPIRIGVIGDSISHGENASRSSPPGQPSYTELVRLALATRCGNRVDLVNLAEPRTSARDGLRKIAPLVASKPDLAVIAFGMNDAGSTDAGSYARHLRALIESIRDSDTYSEILLLTPTRANPEWSWSAAESFPKLRAATLQFETEGVAIADATSLWDVWLSRKRYHDLTGNGINHPNDYGHRLLAQLLMRTFGM